MRSDRDGERDPIPPTPRQLEALAWTARGLKSHEVAPHMDITGHAVLKLLSTAYSNMQVDGILEALAFVGWLRLPNPEAFRVGRRQKTHWTRRKV